MKCKMCMKRGDDLETIRTKRVNMYATGPRHYPTMICIAVCAPLVAAGLSGGAVSDIDVDATRTALTASERIS